MPFFSNCLCIGVYVCKHTFAVHEEFKLQFCLNQMLFVGFLFAVFVNWCFIIVLRKLGWKEVFFSICIIFSLICVCCETDSATLYLEGCRRVFRLLKTNENWSTTKQSVENWIVSLYVYQPYTNTTLIFPNEQNNTDNSIYKYVRYTLT